MESIAGEEKFFLSPDLFRAFRGCPRCALGGLTAHFARFLGEEAGLGQEAELRAERGAATSFGFMCQLGAALHLASAVARPRARAQRREEGKGEERRNERTCAPGRARLQAERSCLLACGTHSETTGAAPQ